MNIQDFKKICAHVLSKAQSDSLPREIDFAIDKGYDRLSGWSVQNSVFPALVNAVHYYPELSENLYSISSLDELDQIRFNRSWDEIKNAPWGDSKAITLMHNLSLSLGGSHLACMIIESYADFYKSFEDNPRSFFYELTERAHKWSYLAPFPGDIEEEIKLIEDHKYEMLVQWTAWWGERRARGAINETDAYGITRLQEYKEKLTEISNKYKALFQESSDIVSKFIKDYEHVIGRDEALRIANEALMSTITPQETQSEIDRLYQQVKPTEEWEIYQELVNILGQEMADYIKANSYAWPDLENIRNFIGSLFESEHEQELGEAARDIQIEAVNNTHGITDLVNKLQRLLNIYENNQSNWLFPDATQSQKEVLEIFRQTGSFFPEYDQARYNIAYQAWDETKNQSLLDLKLKLEELWQDYLSSTGRQDLSLISRARSILISNFTTEVSGLIIRYMEKIGEAVIRTIWADDLERYLNRLANQAEEDQARRNIIEKYKIIFKRFGLTDNEIEVLTNQAWGKTVTREDLINYLDNEVERLEIEKFEHDKQIIIEQFISNNPDVPNTTLQEIIAIAVKEIEVTDWPGKDTGQVAKIDRLQILLNAYLQTWRDNREKDAIKKREEIIKEFIAEKKDILEYAIISRIAENALSFITDIFDFDGLRNKLNELFNEKLKEALDYLETTKEDLLAEFRRKCSYEDPRPTSEEVEQIINVALVSITEPVNFPTNYNIQVYKSDLERKLEELLEGWQDTNIIPEPEPKPKPETEPKPKPETEPEPKPRPSLSSKLMKYVPLALGMIALSDKMTKENEK